MGRRRRQLLVVESAILLAALTATAMSSRAGDWDDPGLLALLAALTLGSQAVNLEARGIHVSAAFVGLVLAMALLGPAPAVAIGIASIGVAAARRRPTTDQLLSNLATYAAFPLLGALALRALEDDVPRQELGFAVLVAAVFLAANLVNFLLIVGHTLYLRGGSLLKAVREVYLPVLPWEATTAVATGIAAYCHERFGLEAVLIIGLLLFGLQHLLRAVLVAEQRLDQLGVLYQGLLGVLLHTLGLRDRMTARHSAAVARYSRALARAAGLPSHDQEIAHLSGMLHDIGKVMFTDTILSSAKQLTEEDRRLIREHPRRGAEIVRRVNGFDEVARVIEHHHERMDGRGYYEVPGEDVPVIARILSITDTYDVMTARDSYRTPVTHEAAVAELRAVSGTQLDGRLVDIFVDLLETGELEFRHGTEADFEAELRRVSRTALSASG